MSQAIADKAKIYEEKFKGKSAFVKDGYSAGFVHMLNEAVEHYKKALVEKETEVIPHAQKLDEILAILKKD